MAEESVEVKEQEPNFEIIDDTPEEDRGKVPMPESETVEPSDDELENYSDTVKKRIGKLKKGYHDIRREKEASERRETEAYNYAKSAHEENKQLKARLQEGETVLVEQSKAKAEAELEAAKQAYRKAYEEGDPDKVTDAQVRVSQATNDKTKWESYTPQYKKEEKPLQTDPNPVYPNTNVPPRDAKAEAWYQKNVWFGNDEKMTKEAYKHHETLVRDGVDPRSDEYYDKIDSRMRQVFPTHFVEESGDEIDISQQSGKPANVVAPVKRSPSSKKIRLTQTQVALAKRLGVSLEDYAKQVAVLNNK